MKFSSTLALWLWINQSGIGKHSVNRNMFNYKMLNFYFFFLTRLLFSSSPSLSPRAGRAASPGRSPASRKFKSKALQLSLSKKFWLLSFSVSNQHWLVKGGMKTVYFAYHSFLYFPSYPSLSFSHCFQQWCQLIISLFSLVSLRVSLKKTKNKQ